MLRILTIGPRATIQDLGRLGFRHSGVPTSGVFDRLSAAVANALIGNPPGAAVVEFCLLGGRFLAEIPLALALAGAPMVARVETAAGRAIPLRIPQTIGLLAGDRLEIGGSASGARLFLAVRGGWTSEAILGSRSSEDALTPGTVLPANPGGTPIRRLRDVVVPDPGGGPIRVVEGPDASAVVSGSLEVGDFVVESESDRVGLRLEGPRIEVRADPSRLSAPVGFGAVQIAGGRPILLGPACGTMGGYPVVAHVISADLDRLGQARPGTTLRFARIGLNEARRLDRLDREARSRLALRLATLASDRPGP